MILLHQPARTPTGRRRSTPKLHSAPEPPRSRVIRGYLLVSSREEQKGTPFGMTGFVMAEDTGCVRKSGRWAPYFQMQTARPMAAPGGGRVKIVLALLWGGCFGRGGRVAGRRYKGDVDGVVHAR